jgi:hypothetical protein
MYVYILFFIGKNYEAIVKMIEILQLKLKDKVFKNRMLLFGKKSKRILSKF